MKPYLISRIIVVVVFGVLLGLSTYQGHLKVQALGRDEFLKRQAANFDRRQTQPIPLTALVCGGVLGTGVTVGVYELVAFGVLKLLEKKDRHGRRRSSRQY